MSATLFGFVEMPTPGFPLRFFPGAFFDTPWLIHYNRIGIKYVSVFYGNCERYEPPKLLPTHP
jgi:hypothetical protein